MFFTILRNGFGGCLRIFLRQSGDQNWPKIVQDPLRAATQHDVFALIFQGPRLQITHNNVQYMTPDFGQYITVDAHKLSLSKMWRRRLVQELRDIDILAHQLPGGQI